jgi:IS4 transposase
MASFAAQARNLKRQLPHSSTILRDVVNESRIRELCRAVDHSWRDCFWRPSVVILTFLRQVLLPGCSCRQTVACTLADPALTSARRRRPAADPSGYSQARQRLPRALLESLARDLSDQLHEPERRWRGHRVRVVDGTGVSMPDTPELQAVFPQPATQARGCGFPVARLLAVFCWCSGALLELLVDSLHVGELTLFRRLLATFEPDDVVLADRLYGNYAELAELQGRGVHAVCRVNRARRVDLRQGTRLGRHDRCLTWKRPKRAPADLTPQQWAQLPDQLTVRVVRITTTCRRAFRKHRIDIVTTLLDPVQYPPAALGELYRERWLAELSLRSLKTTLGMDVLRCRSPEMVRKELAVFHIVYNGIRLLMREAARAHQIDPHRLSFAGTRQRLLAWLPRWLTLRRRSPSGNLLPQLLADIAADLLPQRPDRHEPRAIKRRRKSFPYLVHPRHRARKTAHYDKR